MYHSFALQKRLHSFITLSAEERYFNLEQTNPEFLQRFPQYIIASYLGISRETLSRIRSNTLKPMNIIEVLPSLHEVLMQLKPHLHPSGNKIKHPSFIKPTKMLLEYLHKHLNLSEEFSEKFDTMFRHEYVK